jgi:hypothetical protein
MSTRPACEASECAAWFAGRIPDGWFTEPVTVRVDRDEILVTGSLAMPEVAEAATAPEAESADGSGPDTADLARVAAESRIAGFREETRAQRMAIADAAQATWHRTVSWTVRCGPVDTAFTTASVPVMTRLRFDQRQVLDTLIDAGVARSRSEAVVWCVRQVGEHQSEWIGRLQDAMTEVERIRNEGP